MEKTVQLSSTKPLSVKWQALAKGLHDGSMFSAFGPRNWKLYFTLFGMSIHRTWNTFSDQEWITEDCVNLVTRIHSFQAISFNSTIWIGPPAEKKITICGRCTGGPRRVLATRASVKPMVSFSTHPIDLHAIYLESSLCASICSALLDTAWTDRSSA